MWKILGSSAFMFDCAPTVCTGLKQNWYAPKPLINLLNEKLSQTRKMYNFFINGSVLRIIVDL